ncbi:MAG TPA: acyloxyacyl hydrolase [Elainellaceae cyanobacterium]
MNNTGETLIRCARSLTISSVGKLQTNQPCLHRPVMVALAACTMALYPMKGLHANISEELDSLDSLDSLEKIDQSIPEVRQSFTPSPEPISIQNSHPEISPDFSPISSPNSSYNPATEFHSQTSYSLAPSPDTTLESPEASPEASPDVSLTIASDISPDTLLTAPEDVSSATPLEASLENSSENSSENSPAFGSRGLQRWYVQGGGATTFENNFGLVGAGVSHFFANGHSVNLELNGMAFDQTGDDAVGLNLAVLLRWHFIRQQNWSLYVDGGAGILGTTNDVPSTGSSFNFTPQAGGGATIRIDDEKRLMVGLRWHHISNAELYEGNPGRDSVLGYVGVNVPF